MAAQYDPTTGKYKDSQNNSFTINGGGTLVHGSPLTNTQTGQQGTFINGQFTPKK